MDFNTICFGCFEEKKNQGRCVHCGYDNTTPIENPQYLKPGTILNGKFLIGKGLGHGGFGVTYLGFDLNLNIKVAIKEYLPQNYAARTQNKTQITIYPGASTAAFKQGVKKFLDEAKTVAKFNQNPNIVTVRDFFSENATAYMVMDYISGMDLRGYLLKRGRPLLYTEALMLLNPIINALQVVHDNGVLHRDISPDNIYITDDGVPILLDFGAARQFLNQDGGMSVILKPGYAPFEQYNRNGKSGPFTDLYGFAATFYHVVTGKKPADALERLEEDTLIAPSKLGISMPPNGERALLKALSVKYTARQQSMREFSNEINAGSENAVANMPSSNRKRQKNAVYDHAGSNPPLYSNQNIQPQKYNKPKRNKEKKSGMVALLSILVVALIVSVALIVGDLNDTVRVSNDVVIDVASDVAPDVAPEPVVEDQGKGSGQKSAQPQREQESNNDINFDADVDNRFEREGDIPDDEVEVIPDEDVNTDQYLGIYTGMYMNNSGEMYLSMDIYYTEYFGEGVAGIWATVEFAPGPDNMTGEYGMYEAVGAAMIGDGTMYMEGAQWLSEQPPGYNMLSMSGQIVGNELFGLFDRDYSPEFYLVK
jgi:serine/threonine protein kinase